MLEEEIDGCELSISSFVVAEYESELVAARGGWLEGDNEDELPSSLLKANLFQYCIPKDNLMKGMKKLEMIKDIQIERELGTYQFEFSYTKPEFRGCHIMGRLNAVHIKRAKLKGATKMQVHAYKSNTKSINASSRSGFRITKEYTSNNPHIRDIYPDNAMVLMEKEL